MVDFTKRGLAEHLKLNYKNDSNYSCEFSSNFQKAIDFFNSPAFYRNFELESCFSVYFLGRDGKKDIGNLVLEDLTTKNGCVYSTGIVNRDTAISLAKSIASFLKRNGYCCNTSGFEELHTYVNVFFEPKPKKSYILKLRT
jgi:hypothetical protein